jgi:hypothetical protein
MTVWAAGWLWRQSWTGFIRGCAAPKQPEGGIAGASWPEGAWVVTQRWCGGEVQLPGTFAGGRVVCSHCGGVNRDDVLGSVPVGEADAGLMRAPGYRGHRRVSAVQRPGRPGGGITAAGGKGQAVDN